VNEIHEARKSAGLTLQQVGATIGFSHEYVRLAEQGGITVTPERKQLILNAIAHLKNITTTLRLETNNARSEFYARNVGAPKPGRPYKATQQPPRLKSRKFKNPKI
jgi:transcriptional regulator with XRE-family HTH domain